MGSQPPLSRQMGRAAGRWWRRHGPWVRRVGGPVGRGWGHLAAYGWFAAYLWIGLLLAASGQRLTGGTSPLLVVTAVGGGGAIGWWQARHRLRRLDDPDLGPLRHVGVALASWLAAVGVAVALAWPDG